VCANPCIVLKIPFMARHREAGGRRKRCVWGVREEHPQAESSCWVIPSVIGAWMWNKEVSYSGKGPLSLWAVVLIEGWGDITMSSLESLGTSYVS